MSKYTIVSKNKSGNKSGEIYEVKYQLENDNNLYKLSLYCLRQLDDGSYRYAFKAEENKVGIETKEDSDLFLQEFYKFQKGGSYRANHPINYKQSELLKQEIKKQEDNLYELKRKLEKVENDERKAKFKNYYDGVDLEALNNYVDLVVNTIRNGKDYYLSGIEFNIWEGHRIFVFDKKTNKRLKVITIRDGEIKSRDLTEDDM